MTTYQAFWDESGVNREDAWLTVAGFLAPVEQWASFDTAWRDQLSRFGISVFHANRFNAREAPEFAGWTPQQRAEAAEALIDVIEQHAVGSVSISVPGRAIREASPARMKGRAGHPYAIASRLCMVESAGLLLGTLKLEGDLTIDHIFASGADGHGQLRAAHDHESVRPKRVEHLALGTITFGSQVENPPLQAADFLAWEVNRLTQRSQQSPGANLRRFWSLPHRWWRVEEDDIGAQILMSVSVEWSKPDTVRSLRRSRRGSHPAR